MERPIVLCGLGRMGSRVLEYLLAAELPVRLASNLTRGQAEDLYATAPRARRCPRLSSGRSVARP